jgi:hypothetical protein
VFLGLQRERRGEEVLDSYSTFCSVARSRQAFTAIISKIQSYLGPIMVTKFSLRATASSVFYISAE